MGYRKSHKEKKKQLHQQQEQAAVQEEKFHDSRSHGGTSLGGLYADPDVVGLKNGRVLRRDDSGRIVDLDGAPAWTLKFYEKFGIVWSTVLFGLIMFIMWPVVLALVVGLLVALGTQIITAIPGMVASTLGMQLSVLLSSTERFVFSWVMPVVFLVITLGILAGWGAVKLCQRLLDLSSGLARGLMNGHGETPKENYQRRKEEKRERKIADAQLVSRVKKERAAEKEAKKKARADVAEAMEKNKDL